MDDKGERVCGVVSVLLCLLNGAGLLLFTAVFLRIRPEFAALYGSAKVSIPFATRIMLETPVWAAVLLLLVLLAALVAKEWLAPKWKPLVLNVGWLLAGIAISIVLLVLLAFPLVNMLAATLNGASAPVE